MGSSQVDAADCVAWPLPRAAYVHVPFCRHRCGYCNFSVLAGHDDYAGDFLRALERELNLLGYRRQVDTVFIGGGTPTHLNVEYLAALLELLACWFELSAAGEFSVEANPSDVTEEKLKLFQQFGVNRISLGVQSFASSKLRQLERDHDQAIAQQAIGLAAEVLGNVSIDLIFAAPGETLNSWQADLQTALSLPINHLSTYGLTFEKGTQFWNRLYRGELSEAGEGLQLSMYQDAIRLSQQAGWQHYEVSNFALPGYQCRHNQAYWEGRGWYAVGPGAAAFVDGYRTVNHRSPTTYIRKLLKGEPAIAESDRLSRETWARERLVFGLRMLAGVDLEVIEAETEFSLRNACGEALDGFVQMGLLERSGSRVKLSSRGLFVSDSVLARLL